MRTVLVLLALLSASVQAAIPVPERPITDPKSVTSPANPKAAPIPLEDLAVTRGVADVAWSIDGKAVFISTNFTGRYNLWRVDAAGSWPAQLTQSDEFQDRLVPSPDGNTLLFNQDVGGNERYDLYSVPTRGGPVTQLTATPDVSEEDAYFSPDGRSVALKVKPVSGATYNIAVMDLATRQIRTLTQESVADRNWDVVGWTPDGRSLIANRTKVDSSEASVWRIEVANGTKSPLSIEKERVYIAASSVSADGRLLAISSNEQTGQMRAGILELATKQYRWLKPTPWEQFSGQSSRAPARMVGQRSRSSMSALAASARSTSRRVTTTRRRRSRPPLHPTPSGCWCSIARPTRPSTSGSRTWRRARTGR
jgi:dipeptidyl aminopeptidase/acylaminoacyl peptidase